MGLFGRMLSVNVVLIVRAELVCIVILLYLFFFSLRYWENEEKKRFLRMCICALGHVTFDMITVYTVNHLETIPLWMNNLLHMVFYEFAIVFCYEFLCYVVNHTFSHSIAQKIAKYVMLVPVLYPLTLLFLKIDYLEGRGTNYSYGPNVFMGYGTAMMLFLISFLLVLFSKKMESSIKYVLLPMLSLMLIGIMIQVFIPELLFTGAAITLVVVGMYFAVENPLNKYKQQAYFDMGTGVRNRNCYEEDLLYLNEKYAEKAGKMELAYVICDLNGLKMTNDQYGHTAGDELIRLAAHLLTIHMRRAYRIYRIGGDEFAVLYLDEKLSTIEEEVKTVRRECQNMKTADGVPLSMAIGYAVLKENGVLSDMIVAADERMYEDKAKMKRGNVVG